MIEYIIRWHGKYGKGAKQSWWTETLADSADMIAALEDIEDLSGPDRELEAVIRVEFIDGQWVGRDETEEVRRILRERERNQQAIAAKAYADSPLERVE